MPSVESLFDVINGVSSSSVRISIKKSDMYEIPFVRPTHNFRRLVAGYVMRSEISPENIFDEDSLIVSTDGEGSHTFAYVYPAMFVPNSNVAVLIPKRPISLEEKLFFALAITQSRWRFSYGRKPKGKRLRMMELPFCPRWVKSLNIASYQDQYKMLFPEKKLGQEHKKSRFSRVDEIFTVSYGTNHELNALEIDRKGIAFVSRTSLNNGISARVAKVDKEPIEAPCITVALGGSVLETFLQEEPTYQGRDVAVLSPKSNMSRDELLWYVSAIRQHQFRFNYGRQANRQLPELVVPLCPESFKSN
ncbi:MAG: restriction endonuclease subunit S [bacterium]|nr:restriction endonuclease subunit S [bacterium]